MITRARATTDPADLLGRLVDEGSFLPLYASSPAAHAFGPEVVGGLARVGGRPIAVYAIDPRRGQGFVTSRGAIKIRRVMDKAQDLGVPVVALLQSPGVDVQEGLKSGEAYTSVIAANIALSGVVPQIAVVVGVTMGAPAYSATLMDLVLFNKTRSHLVVTGPTVVAKMLGEETTLAELGGAEVHAKTTGIAHAVDRTLADQIERVKLLLALLPSNRLEDAPAATPRAPSASMPKLPQRADEPFDMAPFVAALVDGSESLEYGPDFGAALVCTWARIDGFVVGIVANQSLVGGGAIDAFAARKGARFIRLCDAYNIPILTLIDVPGFLPGAKQEQLGLLRHGAELCAAMQTSVPRLSVIVRRCYGAAAFVMMQSRTQGGDLVLALEDARIAVMGFEAAKHMVYASDPEPDLRRADYFRDYESPLNALREGLVDEVVPPGELRPRLARHLAWLNRRRERPLTARRHAILP